MHRVTLALVLWFSLATVSAAQQAAPPLDSAQAYQAKLQHPVTYDVELVVAVTAPYHTKKLRVWLPIPPSDNVQSAKSRAIQVFPHEIKPTLATEKVHGNQFAYFEFDHPQGAQIIRHQFQVTTHELHWNLDPAKIDAPSQWPESFTPYLRGDQAVVVNDLIAAQAKEIVKVRRNPAADLGLVMDWMHQNMTYDHGQASLAASSLHALENKTGHCSDYHGLCSALGRALGYPTRVTYGLAMLPKNSPSHCKLEAYLPPYGWVSFDVSETQKLIKAIAKDDKLSASERDNLTQAAIHRLRSGFRDNTWLLVTRGTGYELAPPAAKKVNVVRTIYAEADGVALPEPDPADPKQTEFAWQVGMKITPDRQVRYPFSR